MCYAWYYIILRIVPYYGILRLTEQIKPHPLIKIYISNFQGCLYMISLLEIDPESCSDHFGGVESDFWWVFAGFVTIFAILWFFGNVGFRRNKPRGLWAAWPSPSLVWPPLVWLNLFRQQYFYRSSTCLGIFGVWLESCLQWLHMQTGCFPSLCSYRVLRNMLQRL